MIVCEPVKGFVPLVSSVFSLAQVARDVISRMVISSFLRFFCSLDLEENQQRGRGRGGGVHARMQDETRGYHGETNKFRQIARPIIAGVADVRNAIPRWAILRLFFAPCIPILYVYIYVYMYMYIYIYIISYHFTILIRLFLFSLYFQLPGHACFSHKRLTEPRTKVSIVIKFADTCRAEWRFPSSIYPPYIYLYIHIYIYIFIIFIQLKKRENCSQIFLFRGSHAISPYRALRSFRSFLFQTCIFSAGSMNHGPGKRRNHDLCYFLPPAPVCIFRSVSSNSSDRVYWIKKKKKKRKEKKRKEKKEKKKEKKKKTCDCWRAIATRHPSCRVSTSMFPL